MTGNVDGEGSSGRMKSTKRKWKAKLLLGEKVEVRGHEDGFEGSWHSGVVVSCGTRTRLVEYDHILVEDGPDKLLDLVRLPPTVDGLVSCTVDQHRCRGSMRPVPPICVAGPEDFAYGLCVDAFHMDAWWEGVIFDHNVGAEKRNVFFPELGHQMLTQLADIRVTQDWDEITEKWQSRGTWLFLDLIQVYEKEWPVPVSLKQIWYDLRYKEAFQRSEWTSRDKATWEKLVLETVNENLAIASIDLMPILDFPRSSNSIEESCTMLELPEVSSKVNHSGLAARDDPHAEVPSDGMQSVDETYWSEKSMSSKFGCGPGFHDGVTNGSAGKDNIKVLKCYKRREKFSAMDAGNAVDGDSSVVSSAIGVNQPTERGSGPGLHESITDGSAGKDNIKVLKCYKWRKKFSA